MGLSGSAHGWVGKRPPLPEICYKYPAMMKLGAVIPYLNNV